MVKVKSVGYRLSEVVVVYQMETMAQENLFQSPCTFAIYFYFIQEVVFASLAAFSMAASAYCAEWLVPEERAYRTRWINTVPNVPPP